MRIYAMPKPQPQAPKPQKVSEPFSTLELEAFPCAKAAAAGKPDADRFEAAAARGLAALCHCFCVLCFLSVPFLAGWGWLWEFGISLVD